MGGKFALIVVEVGNDCMGDFPDNILPNGVKKWVKQIEACEWVSGQDLLSKGLDQLSDLLQNILQVHDFRQFLEGALNPDTTWPEGSVQPPVYQQGGKGKSDGKGWKGSGGGGMKGGYGWKGGGGRGVWKGGGKG